MSFGLLLTSGVFVGAIVGLAWERLPAWSRMSADQFRIDFAGAVRRMDPAMPILALASAALGIGLTVQVDGWRAMAAGLGAALFVLVVVGSAALLEPMNGKFRRNHPMDDATVAALRHRWARIHVLRSAVSVVAFGCFIAAVAS